VLVKFDKEYAYGDTHDEFKKVAVAATSQPELIIAEVPIQGVYILMLAVKSVQAACTVYTVSQKNWATFLRPITLEILNRSLPN